jgi:hypothetical protein
MSSESSGASLVSRSRRMDRGAVGRSASLRPGTACANRASANSKWSSTTSAFAFCAVARRALELSSRPSARAATPAFSGQPDLSGFRER